MTGGDDGMTIGDERDDEVEDESAGDDSESAGDAVAPLATLAMSAV